MLAEVKMRWVLAAFGALAGATLWALIEAADRELVSQRLLIIVTVAAAGFFSSGLMMAGAVSLRRALAGALLIGGVMGLLTLLVGLRFTDAEDLLNGPFVVLALMAIAVIPVPFLIAQGGAGWRDYPSLFDGSWAIVVRGATAGVFTGIIWGVIALSDELLKIVGIPVIGDFAYSGIVPFLITGAGFGLALAVVIELSHLISARIVVRLLRLLAPAVLVVTAVFVIAAPIQGLSNLFNGLSAASILIAMGISALTLLTLIVDRDEAHAPASPVLQWTARGLSVLLPVLGALAFWAVMVRVVQYGWTPNRLFAVLSAGVLLAYGLWHAFSVLRGTGWQARVRQGNLAMALVVLAVAVLWLTPILNAERMSARSLVARALAGEALDPNDRWAIALWGKPGEAALAELTEAAKSGDLPKLTAWLSDESIPASGGELTAEGRVALQAEVAAAMPLQPASATGTRDSFLMLMQEYELRDLQRACGRLQPDGTASCVMVVADLLPGMPGEEVALIVDYGDYVTMDGLYFRDGYVVREPLRSASGLYPAYEEMRALLAQWQAAPPPASRVELNQLGTGQGGVYLAP
jgi:Domain of unknown function (DUF4153)